MLLEAMEFDGNVRLLHIALGALIGLLFGAAAQISRFCIRRALVGGDESKSAAAVWATALATAIVGFLGANTFGLIAVEDHRFLSIDIPVLAITLGGLMFGAGMVLTRGCISRLTVLSATGNLRAALVLIVFAIVAHATLKGVFAPLRVAIGSVTVEAPFGSLMAFPIVSWVIAFAFLAFAVLAVMQTAPKTSQIIAAIVIGMMPVLGWVGTSTLLMDEFDPLPVQSIAFTLPWTDTLFWTIASSALPATFGVGFVAGVLGGSFASAALRGELQLQSFEGGPQTLRYLSGAGLMGVGGVLAGGCTIGAGLSGVAMLSVAAILALVSIIVGGILTNRALAIAPIAVPAE